MIFIRRETFREYIRLYPVTSLLLAINIALFLALAVSGGTTSVDTLLRFGAIYRAEGETAPLWRYVSSMFLHSGLPHLLFNGVGLYVFAAPLERLIGHVRYLILYLASGIAGNIVSQWLHPIPYMSVGASGALYGVYGALLFIGVLRRGLLDDQSNKTVTVMLAVGVVFSIITPNVNLHAHLGGGVAGFVLMALFVPTMRGMRKPLD